MSWSRGTEAPDPGAPFGHYRLATDTASDVIYQNDIHGRVQWVSPSARDLLGHLPEVLVGSDATDWVHPEDAELLRKARADVQAGRPYEELPIRVRTADGMLRPVLALARPVLGAHGEVVGSVVALHDTGTHAAAPRALATLIEGYRAMLRATDEQDLLRQICEGAVKAGNYAFSWYGRPVDDARKSVQVMAVGGDDQLLLNEVAVSWGDDALGRGPSGISLRTGTTQVCDDLAAPRSGGIRCSISLPVLVDDRVHGALMVYAEEPGAFDRIAQELLENLAAGIGYGIARLSDVARLRVTLDSLLDPHVTLRSVRDETGRIIDLVCNDANDAACRYSGRPKGQLVGSRLAALLPGHELSRNGDLYVQVVETGQPLSLDDIAFTEPPDVDGDRPGPGARVYCDVRAVKVGDGLSLTWREVTERHAAVEALRESEEYYRSLAENSSDVVFLAGATGRPEGHARGRIVSRHDIDARVRAERDQIRREGHYRLLAENAMDLVFAVDLDGVVEWMSPSVTTVLGYAPSDVIGRPASALLHPDDVPLVAEAARQVLEGHSPVYRARFLAKSGEPLWTEASTRGLRDESGKLIGRVVSVRDVDAEVRTARALEREVAFDALTGLGKRALALARVQEVLDTRTAPGWALLVAGVHGMTAINQAYTYTAGDEVLRAVARRLVEATGAHDRVARIAGDEFAILMRDIVTSGDAAAAAERMLAAIRGPVVLDTGKVEVSACIGIAMSEPHEGDAEALLRDATAALRQAGGKGPDRWEFLDGNIAERSRRTLDVQDALREELASNGIRPWFMPIRSLSDGRLRGCEALVRWVRQDGSVLRPKEFLDVAECSDLILLIDRLVLGRSLDALAGWQAGTHVAVNVSAATLSAGSLLDDLRAELDRTGADPRRLHLEVTETAIFHTTSDIVRTMRSIAGLGITWWVDDFGTGYSSIAHLRDLPIGGLKLDRTFTAGITGSDDHPTRLASGLVGLAHGLGLATIAEGVETPTQSAVLLGQGWEMGQGWLYGGPAPP